MNKEKRLETVEQIINNLPPPPSAEETDREFAYSILHLCEHFGPLDCEKGLLTAGFKPEDALDWTEKTHKIILARIGPAKLRENLLYQLHDIFHEDAFFHHDDSSTLFEMVSKFSDAQKERLREILKRIQTPNTHLLYEPDLTAEDRGFLKIVFPKYYEW